MPPRYDDRDRVLSLSVRDLVEAGPPSGHLVLEAAQSRRARMAAGRAVHEHWQAARAGDDAGFQAEVTLRHTLEVDGWTVELSGRVDGLSEVGGRPLVEEVKSTALDHDRLGRTTLEAWPAWTAQLEIYLWLLEVSGRRDAIGRLVLVSLLDGSRHILPLVPDHVRIADFVLRRLARLVRLREARLAWHARRRARPTPTPFASWRDGQQRISDTVRACLAEERRLLVQAPTGLGKTAAVLHGALAWARAHDKQVFWATSRNTQAAGVAATLERFRHRGLDLSWVGLRSKEHLCLNDVVACRPDLCRHADGYHDRLEAGRLVEEAVARGALPPEAAVELGRAHVVCPFQLALDTSEHVDVVVGDVNYALSPTGRLRRHFGEGVAGDWVLVVDEAHQLVDRAREHASPTVSARLARAARAALRAEPALAVQAELADDILAAVLDVCRATPGPHPDDTAQAELAAAPWRELAGRLDGVALDYALLRAHTPWTGPEPDPWIELARQVLRFADVVEEAGPETVALVRVRPGDEQVRLLCLDPSPRLRPWIADLAGFVGCSATLAPHAFFRDLLGLPEDTARLEVPSPFPPERRQVLVAPRVSTRYRDREASAPATARLLGEILGAVPGTVALYFSSFSMLDDLVGRVDLGGRELLRQTPAMTEEARVAWLARLGRRGSPLVLAAVLGGIFAEGVDLPPGALDAIVIVGPALPPVGLERDLLRAYFEDRFGQGWLYASLVPGMTRVVQAAGRLVRRPEDRGVVVLVGKRFRWREHAALLPPDWSPATPDDPVAAVRAFWALPDGAPA
ncbi:MAG: hypothetical protein H6732_14940 [Alphaproteobacteria bacterium]|nr:hypothetical protein [Alphaproteobacteria bacterium]